jgi:hypothetical protein
MPRRRPVQRNEFLRSYDTSRNAALGDDINWCFIPGGGSLKNGIVGNLTGPVAWLRGSYRKPDFTGTFTSRYIFRGVR